MKKIYWSIPVLLILIGFFFLKRSNSSNGKTEISQDGNGQFSSELEAGASVPLTSDLSLTEDLSSEFMAGFGKSESSPRNDLVLLFEVLTTFNQTLQGRSELPRTTNKALTATLLGANNDRIRFLSPTSPALSKKNELVDRWKTPFFFHFEDAFTPEIRSAGPDKVMWTSDDLFFSFSP